MTATASKSTEGPSSPEINLKELQENKAAAVKAVEEATVAIEKAEKPEEKAKAEEALGVAAATLADIEAIEKHVAEAEKAAEESLAGEKKDLSKVSPANIEADFSLLAKDKEGAELRGLKIGTKGVLLVMKGVGITFVPGLQIQERPSGNCLA